MRRGLMEGGYQCRYPEDTVWARRQGGGALASASAQGDTWTGPRSVLRCLLTRRPGNTVLGRCRQSREGRRCGDYRKNRSVPCRGLDRVGSCGLQSSPSTPGESAGRCRVRRPGLRALLCAPRRPPSSSPALTLGLLAGMTRAGSASCISQVFPCLFLRIPTSALGVVTVCSSSQMRKLSCGGLSG